MPEQIIVYEPHKSLNSNPEVSIIIVNWNGKHLLKNCLKSCFKQAFSQAEVIVVDNNSSDNSLKYLITTYPQITVVRNPANVGFGRAANTAASLAKGNYLMFLDNDAWLHPLTIKNLTEVLKSNSKIKVVGPLILNSNGSVQNFNFKVSWLAKTVVPAKVETLPKTRLSSVFFVPSCAFLVEKNFFQQLGGFDPAYFLYYEDVDFCWRARLNGAEVVLCPWSFAYHYGSASKASLFLHKLYEQNFNLEAEEVFYKWRNRLRLILKNASLDLAFFASLAIGLKLAAKFFLAAVTWRTELAKQYARALLWNLKTVPNLLQERRKIQAQRVLPDKAVLEQTMIFQLKNQKQKIS